VSDTKSFLIRNFPFSPLSFAAAAVFFLGGCDSKPMVNVYDKSILNTPIACLRLVVTPPDRKIESAMRKLYRFDQTCPMQLTVSYKNGITCNSTFNVQTKSVNGFPSSYLNMELRKGFSLKYSYYIDLMEDVTPKDLEKGFARMKEDLDL
jgi:hypothetical protein